MEPGTRVLTPNGNGYGTVIERAIPVPFPGEQVWVQLDELFPSLPEFYEIEDLEVIE